MDVTDRPEINSTMHGIAEGERSRNGAEAVCTNYRLLMIISSKMPNGALLETGSSSAPVFMLQFCVLKALQQKYDSRRNSARRYHFRPQQLCGAADEPHAGKLSRPDDNFAAHWSSVADHFEGYREVQPKQFTGGANG